MELEDLINYSEQYEHKLVDNLTDRNDNPIKGCINFRERTIKYNSDYSTPADLAETLCHEIQHHYFIKELGYDMHETIVEELGLHLLYDNRKSIERYVVNKLGGKDERQTRSY